MSQADEALDSFELDILDTEEPIPFLRPITTQHTRLFTTDVRAYTNPPDGNTLSAALLSESPADPDASSAFPSGDKSVLYVGLESLFHADIRAAETLPMCSALLEEYFRIPGGTFRPSQQEVCLGVLQGHHTLAVCPTGWGKSLCYQFPMLVHRLLFRNAFEQWQQKRDATAASATQVNVSASHTDDAEPTTTNTVPLSPMPVSRFCLVISPLLSLMTDQMDKISGTGALKAVVLSSQTGADRAARILEELVSPTCSIDVVFISPEKLISHRRLRDVLLSQHQRLAMVCVDEVHCVSKWAYDFRPSFLYVSRLLDELVQGKASSLSTTGTVTASTTQDALHFYYGTSHCATRTTYLCLTATASESVIADLSAAFHIESTIVCTDLARNNLQLESVDTLARAAAFSHSTSHAGATGCGSVVAAADAKLVPPPARIIQDALLEAVASLPHPMIIYVQSRADADEIASYITSRLGCERDQPSTASDGVGACEPRPAPVFGRYKESQVNASTHTASTPAGHKASIARTSKRLVVRCYHAALSRSQRTSTQQQFLQDKVDVLVATVAFGMGIDKRNIRSIVHAHAPSSLEGYVQEVGRAGRDGQPSRCLVLYNPFDYFDLRCRLWSSLLSPREMRDIIRAITTSSYTRAVDGHLGGERGSAVALISCARIATTLAIAEETVETILFLLLSLSPTGSLTGKQFYKGVRGGAPLGYKVVVTPSAAEADKDGARPPQKRPRSGRQAAAAAAAACLAPEGSGVSSLLAQLHARDPVMDALARVGSAGIENLVDFANRLGMSMTDLQYRLDDLTVSGAVTLYARGHALLIEMGPDAPELGTAPVLDALTSWLFELYNGRLAEQVKGLRALFEVLQAPSHERVQRMLTSASVVAWTPPPPRLSKLEAVSIANDFVEKNRLRVTSVYEAARALLGVMPKSQISHGKFAGQLPLSHSWYLHSPHFGALREFDLDWVVRVLSAHDLDSAPASSLS